MISVGKLVKIEALRPCLDKSTGLRLFGALEDLRKHVPISGLEIGR